MRLGLVGSANYYADLAYNLTRAHTDVCGSDEQQSGEQYTSL